MIIVLISPDPTLTVGNVTYVMEKVTKDKRRQLWGRLLDYRGSFLWRRGPRRVRQPPLRRKRPDPVILVEIYSSHSSEEEKTHACSDVYANCHPESSWEYLTSLLYEEDELTAVDQARSFLPPRGKLTTSKCLMLVWSYRTWL